MKRLRHSALWLLVIWLSQVPAHGQQPPGTPPDDRKPMRTEAGLVIEEVIVTVSKRAESLQDVMGSVSAFSGDTLAQNNIQDFATLADLIPGMVVQRQEASADDVTVRGISRTRDGPSPVAFHINDMFTAMRGEPYYDLAAVEVVRGPSGTVYGRNATAGAINAKWAPPEDIWAVGGDVRYSSLEEQRLRAYFNIPFFGEGDRRLLGRIAAVSREVDGTLDNLLTSDSGDPNNIKDHFVRLFLSSEPTDNLQLGLRAVRYESEPRKTNVVFSPSLETRRGGTFEELGAEPLPDDLTKVRSLAHERFGEALDEFTRVAGDITWSLQGLPLLGAMDIVLVGGEVRREFISIFDLDGTEEPLLEGRDNTREDTRRSAELRFVSQNASGFDWLLGFFWYRQTREQDLDVQVRQFVRPSDLGAPALPLEPEIPADITVETRDRRITDFSRAAFANFNVDLARLLGGPKIELTTGVRYNVDEFSNNTARNDIFVSAPGFDVPVVRQSNIRQFADFDELTGEIGARWFYSDDGMAYLKFARGYKPGLAQLVESPSGATQNPVDPEFLNAWEAGWKTGLFDQSLLLNFSAFHYDYRDLQVSQIIPGGVVTDNAAAATIRGLELDARWSPVEALHLQAGLAFTDATYDQFCVNDPERGEVDPQPGCTEENPINAEGERLTAAPEYSAVLLLRYTFDLGDFGTLTPSLKTSWSDELNRRGLGNDVDIVDAHSNSDIRLTWASRGGHWQVEGFVENIEDHDDIFFTAFTPLGGRPHTVTLLSNPPPRIYGVSLVTRF